MTKILSGKLVAEKIQKKLGDEIKLLRGVPTLVIIQVGEVPESSAYIERKKKFGEIIGARVEHIKLPNDVSQFEVITTIEACNRRDDVHGIIVQMPIPKNLDRYAIVEAVDPKKDVDGLHSRNAGLIYERAFGGQDPKNVPEGLVPATAKGVIAILKHYKIGIQGKKVLVIGRSLLVGKPTAMLLLRENATVTIAHSKTKNLKKIIKDFDIVVVAVGKPKFLGKGCFKKGQVIIDIGTNALGGRKTLEEIGLPAGQAGKRKLVGDVNFDEVSKIVRAITPVPGGMGPMTVAMLFENLLEAYALQK